MNTSVAGVITRAALVVLLIALPSMLLPDTSFDTIIMVSFIALCAAIFTMVEYSSKAPSLVEFRDAPPFNRVRFVALLATVFSLTMIALHDTAPTAMTEMFKTAGRSLGQAIDFPHSPVRLMVLMMPEDAPIALLRQVQTAAGISYLVSLLSLGVFVFALRIKGWPAGGRDFNVWVNLPTFDPTIGGDVADRLNRDGIANLILGFLLPFIIPALVKLAGDFINPISLANPHSLIWMMSAWAFLPASLMMRGAAMARVAQMIRDQRNEGIEDAEAQLSPA